MFTITAADAKIKSYNKESNYHSKQRQKKKEDKTKINEKQI